MKKKLNEDVIKNELSEGSAFFRKAASPIPTPQPKEKTEIPQNDQTNHDTTQPRNHDTVTPRYRATTLEQIRKALKAFGKEAATHRFTASEKREIADLIYFYKKNEIRTSENEITRIAVNFMIDDHKENGEQSVLDRVLKLLNE